MACREASERGECGGIVTSEPITEQWLSESGFKWDEIDREINKYWVLWLGDCLNERLPDPRSLGVEVTKGPDDWWYCWLRSDYPGRYSRFLHVRHLRVTNELIWMIEGLTGQTWMPINNLYGSMRTPEQAAYLRREASVEEEQDD